MAVVVEVVGSDQSELVSELVAELVVVVVAAAAVVGFVLFGPSEGL